MKAGMGFGEMAPSPEERKEEIPQGVRGLEDVSADALARASERSEVKSVEAHLEKEVRELKPELEKTPEGERERIGVGLQNVGFFVEEAKNNFFAGVFNKLAETQPEAKSTVTKFVTKLGNGFDRDAKKARERMEAIEKTKNRETLANAGYLLGNAVKYGRTVLDIAGVTVAAPLRFVTLGAMAFARGADAAKEVRLENEKVIEKTRIEDIEKAAEEAWAVYLAAQNRNVEQAYAQYQEAEKRGDMKEIGDAKTTLALAERDTNVHKITAKDLEKAYREKLPADILKRLEAKSPEQPSLVNRMVQGFMRVHIERSVKRLERKTANIDENGKLSAKEKKAKRERLFNRFDRRLRDYDRVVSQFGTVDALAMGARYAEVAAKAAVYVPTAYIALEKAFEMVGDAFTNTEAAEAMEGLREHAAEVPPAGSLPLVIESGAAPKLQGEIVENLKVHAGMPETGGAELSGKEVVSQGSRFSVSKGGTAFGMPNAPMEMHPAEAVPGVEISHAHPDVPEGSPKLGGKPETMGTHEGVSEKEISAGPKAVEVSGIKEKITIGTEQMKLATVGEGEGVTHAIVRQLKVNPEQFGYSPKSGVDLDKWAVLKSKEIAIENGYIKPDGTEIRVLDQGPKGNPAYILEKDASGKLKATEYLSEKPTGGDGVKSAYEYEWKKPGSPQNEMSVWGTREGFRYKTPSGAWSTQAYNTAEEAPKAQEEKLTALQHMVEEAKNAPFHEIGVKDVDVVELEKAAMPALERVQVGKMPELKFPEWLSERIEYSKLAETLPEKTASLEALEGNFSDYSLAAQEHAVKSLDLFEKQLDYMEKHSDTLGLTSTQEDFIEMSKDSVEDMREALKETQEAFKEQLEEVGVSYQSYEKAVISKELTTKHIFEMAEKKELDMKKWGAFAKWLHGLRPTDEERWMKVDDFLRSRFKG